ncbi:MAG: geopeptide radical SAM maturase [Desulfuromonadaceae bacterium]
MELSRYLKVYSSTGKPGRVLLFATRRCAVLELSESLWSRVCSGGDLAEKEIETLQRLKVMVPDRSVERKELLDTFNRANRMKRPFTALITLTLECNLACSYCFEEPFRGSLRMTDDTAKLLITMLENKMKAGLDVKVDFYGGEALMELSRLKSIAGLLHEAARVNGVAFEFFIISNGTLLNRQVVQELLPLGLVGAKLTLDGPPDIHDQQRPFVSGRESFAPILRNIKEICDLISLELGSNYTRDNYLRFPEMLDILLQEGVTPDKLAAVGFFPVFPKSDGSVSGECNSVCSACDEPWMIEAGLFLRGQILRRGFVAPKTRMASCMIEFDNDIVVGYDGSLYKCPVFMGQEEMCVGTLADGISDYRESHNLDVWKNDECLECAYLPLCFGGCRFFSKLKTGSIDGVDCRRAMLDASLETIVRQDLGM